MWDIVPGSKAEVELKQCFWDFYRAPYGYWATLPLWEAREAAALLLGINPDEIDVSHTLTDEWIAYESFGYSLQTFQEEFDCRLSHQRTRLKDHERLIERAAMAGQFGKTTKLDEIFPIAPARILKWADQFKIRCPERLRQSLTNPTVVEPEPRDDISPRRERSLLRLIGALLVELKLSAGISQASIIETLIDVHGSKDGISKSGIENIFSAANRQLEDY